MDSEVQMPGNNEKANLKLQIRNTESKFEEAMFKWDLYETEATILHEKLEHLKAKLKKLGKTSGKNKAKKSQK